jgi:hypothetical protein
VDREDDSNAMTEYEQWCLESGELDAINRLLAAAALGTVYDMRSEREDQRVD